MEIQTCAICDCHCLNESRSLDVGNYVPRCDIKIIISVINHVSV